MKDAVFIPSLGVIVPVYSIKPMVTLAYSATNVYSLIRDDTMYNSKDMMIKRSVQLDSKAIIQISTDMSAIAPSAAEAEEAYKENIRRLNEKWKEEDSKSKKKKKNADEDEIDDVVSDVMFHEIIVSRVLIEQDPVPIQQTKPYQMLAEKHEEALQKNLARLYRAVQLRGEALQHLRTPSEESVMSTVDDLIPELSETSADIAALNRQGLETFEAKLRQDVQDKEDAIHKVYDWFESNVVSRYNKRSKSMSGIFTEPEVKIADHVLSRQELLDDLFKNELIFMGDTLPKKK